MSMTLRIFGIRKLKDVEIAELTGKTYREISESQFFRTLFPSAPATAGYRFYEDRHGTMKSIEHMTPYVYSYQELEKLFDTALTFQKHKSKIPPECIQAIIKCYILQE